MAAAYSGIRLGLKYFQHYITASSGKGHGVHSPFVYAFIRNVVMDEGRPGDYALITARRKKWLSDQRTVAFKDLGGKGDGSARQRSVSELARHSLSDPKFGRFLFRLARYYSPGRMLELGTSLGISGAWLLAGAGERSALTTIEGSEAVAALAAESFTGLNAAQVDIRCGDFAIVLPQVLGEDRPFDLVFIDGNHRGEPLLGYFNALLRQSPRPLVIILHDIHWSPEMEEAWQVICGMPEVKLSIDLFYAGLIFFNDQFLLKQHFRIRF